MNKVIVTGSSYGIGKAIALKFLEMGCEVIGLDINNSSITHNNYVHYVCNVSDKDSLPNIQNADILINNAGTILERDSISINLLGCINCSEKYAFQSNIKSVINIASASAHNGAEFPLYVASKGGMLSYTKYLAQELGKKYNALCNSISPGGVYTDMNEHILKDNELYIKVLNECLIKKWATSAEIAEWVYFIAVTNKSMTGQDILIDNGEMIKANFIW